VRLLDPHLGFDDDGDPVPVTGPADFEEHQDGELEAEDAARLRRETLCRFLGFLMAGKVPSVTVGKRAVCLGFLLHVPGSPRSYRELGRALGCSGPSAFRRVTRLRAQLAALYAEEDSLG